MVNDTLEELEDTEELQPETNEGDNLSDTAGDLEDLYHKFSSEDTDAPADASQKAGESSGVYDAKGAGETAQSAGKTAETADEVTDTAKDAAQKSRGASIAGYAGRKIGEDVGGNIAETTGGDRETGEELGGYGGEAGGEALYNKYAAKPGTGGAGTPEGVGTGAPATPQVAPATSATPATGATAPAVGTTVAPAASATPAAGAAAPAVGTAVAPLASATAGGAGAAAGGTGAAAGGTAAAAAGGAGAAAVAWPVVVIILALILLIVIILIIVAIVAPRLSHDKEDPVNQSAVASIEAQTRSGKIVFTDPADDLEKIKDGEIGTPALRTMDNLSKLHEQIHIHYTGVREYAPGKTKANDSFEFDITAVDKIKCTDTATGTKATEFPIYLNLNYNWNSLVLPTYSDKVICAVGYYPQIEPPVSTPYKEQFSPGEFPIQKLSERARMAVQEKTAQLIGEMVSQGKSVSADSDPFEILPASITINKAMAEQNFKEPATKGLGAVMTEKIKQLYPGKGYDVYEPLEQIQDYNGIHVSFL